MDNLPATSNGTQGVVSVLPQQNILAPVTAHEHRARINLIQDVMRAVMKDGTHYGVIPGCGDKPTLLKPGAEMLCMTFRLCPALDIKVQELGNGHREYTVTATIRDAHGNFLGQGVGSCSTMESKYRWRGGAGEDTGEPVPKVYWDIKKENPAELKTRWPGLMAKKTADGEWHFFTRVEKAENPDIADTYNTCLKMAKKRALVDATLTATAASDIFTQDIEDMPELAGTATVKRDEPAAEPKKAYRKSTSPAELQRQLMKETAEYRKKKFQPSEENQADAAAVLLSDRKHKMVSKFADIGVSMGQLEGYMGLCVGGARRIEQFTEADVNLLQDIYKQIAAKTGEERAKAIAKFFSFDDVK